ncbi:VOC family protein [Chryseolinea lacunae]|uniref:VOC family protein n=1 Tax=Chryseolinea lacunae TaxID=2801331 RepID=A0ABS1KY03_9BACT|nr:VOC family protein [Chryseolinea lacunae]MBL0743211.1 VOC family protein [Chryseolinea lacunae]
MKIEHLAIWSKDIDNLKEFYVRYFDAVANEKYINPKKNFHSYFLSFSEGCRLELMQMPGIAAGPDDGKQWMGIAHFATSVGSKENVDALTERLRKDGYSIAGEPRTTGDGYYESVVLDPEGNRIEITI